MTDFPITVFHNPGCGTSRNVLAMVRAAGYDPDVIEYLKTGWTTGRLEGLLSAMGATARDILRVRGTPAGELGLTDPGASDEKILASMVLHPILVERPIVITPKGTAVCRPAEAVLPLLERAPDGFVKGDGQVGR